MWNSNNRRALLSYLHRSLHQAFFAFVSGIILFILGVIRCFIFATLITIVINHLPLFSTDEC